MRLTPATPSVAPPTPTATSAPTLEPPPATSSATATPPSGRRPYCAVADVLTPIRDYALHAYTYLDWTGTLPPDYEPPDLVVALTGDEPSLTRFAVDDEPRGADVLAVSGDALYAQVLTNDRQALVRDVAHPNLAALREAAARAAFRLVMLSAYRSYQQQRATFDYWVRVGGYERALRTSARPGHSEHQLGTTIDFGDGQAAPWEYADWATTPVGGWLRDHAVEFGFVQSLSKGKSDVTCYDYEPWHYRWIGRELAVKVAASGLALREYQEIATGRAP